MNKQLLMFLKKLFCKVSINRDFEEYNDGAFKNTQIIDGATLKGAKVIKDDGNIDIVKIENERNKEDEFYEYEC